MRVLHVMASGARGGGADHLLGLLPALGALGVDCSAGVGVDGPLGARLAALGLPWTALDLMRHRLSPRAVVALARLLRRARPDIVHYHGTRAGFYGSLVPLPLRPRQSVYTAHGLAFRQAQRPWRRRLFIQAEARACAAADATLSVARADLHALVAQAGLPPERGTHVANAVDTRRFVPAPQAAARRRLGLAPAALWVGTCARLVPQKAVGDLLAAVAQVPQLHLLVLGDGPEGPRLRQHPLVRSGRALFLGARDDVSACLPALDLFALASHWEGEPIALLEAMACGLPCVASHTPDTAELLQAAGVGQLVPIGAPSQLAAALMQLGADRARRRAWGAGGRTFACSRSYAQQAAQVLAVYRSLSIARPRSPG